MFAGDFDNAGQCSPNIIFEARKCSISTPWRADNSLGKQGVPNRKIWQGCRTLDEGPTPTLESPRRVLEEASM